MGREELANGIVKMGYVDGTEQLIKKALILIQKDQ